MREKEKESEREKKITHRENIHHKDIHSRASDRRKKNRDWF